MHSRTVLGAALAAFLIACGGGAGGGDGGGGGGGGGTPDPGPASGGGGASTQVGSLLAHAGVTSGSALSGQEGGRIFVGSNGGKPVVVHPTPGLKAKPGWTRPAVALGANPRTFSGTATYSTSGVLQGDDGATPATGLWVKPGATLSYTPAGSQGIIVVGGPVVVEGTITLGRTAAGSLSSAGLVVGGTIIVVAPTGVIRARGDVAGVGAIGGDGGAIALSSALGTFVFGDLDASGGDGGAGGGRGGTVVAGLQVLPVPGGPTAVGGGAVLTGTVDVSGGAGGTSTGGAGGFVGFGIPPEGGGGGEIRAGARARPTLPDDVAAHVHGTVLAHGGAGTVGGRGGSVAVSGGALSIAAGTIDASGGGAAGFSAGGVGGGIQVGPIGGEIWVEGMMSVKGGDSGAGTGGAGGLVQLGPDLDGVLASTALHFSADVDASGGLGEQGGLGGEIVLSTPGAVTAVADLLDADAGNGVGTGSGGQGGEISIDSSQDTAYGPVDVSAPLRANGGSSDDGSGGLGGTILVHGSEVACGQASANGGDASVEFVGAPGGTITITSEDDVDSVLGGPLSVRGGAGGNDGAPGVVTVDGAVKPLVNGVFTP